MRAFWQGAPGLSLALRAGADLALCAHSRGSDTQCPGLPVYFQWHRGPSHPWAHSPPEVQNSWEPVFGELSQLERVTEHTDGQWPELIRQHNSDYNPCSHQAKPLDSVSNCQLPSRLPCFPLRTHQEETNMPEPITWDTPLLACNGGTAELSLPEACPLLCLLEPAKCRGRWPIPATQLVLFSSRWSLFPLVDEAAMERGQAQTGQDSPLAFTGSTCSLIQLTELGLVFYPQGLVLDCGGQETFQTPQLRTLGGRVPIVTCSHFMYLLPSGTINSHALMAFFFHPES